MLIHSIEKPSIISYIKYFLLYHRAEIYIAVGAAIVLSAYLYIVPIVDTPDSLTYWENAKFFAHLSNGYPYYYRPPGYPFLIFLSGYPFTHSMRALIVIQSVMAIAIPLLAYHSLLIFGKKTANIAAWLIILSLSNIYFSTAIMSEQFYIFCLMLFMCWVSKLCTTCKTRDIIWATVIAFLTMMVRGVVAPLILLPLLITFIRNYKKGLTALLSLGICLISMYTWIVIKNIYNPDVSKDMTFTNISLTNMEGKTLFSSTYLFSSMFNKVFVSPRIFASKPTPKVERTNGKYTQQLFEILKNDYRDHPGDYSKYATAEIMANVYESSPSMSNWGGISFHILDRQIGVVKADKLLWNVAAEAIKNHPEIGLTWFTNSILYLFGPPYMTQNDVQPVFYLPRLYIYYQNTESAKDQHYIKRTAPHLTDDFADGYGVFFLLLKPIVIILTLMTTPYLIRSKNRLYVFSLVIILMYHVAVTSIFTAPAERYVFTSFPFFLMLLAIGIGSRSSQSRKT